MFARTAEQSRGRRSRLRTLRPPFWYKPRMTPPRAVSLPPELQQRVRAELRAGEKLLWADQPVHDMYRRLTVTLRVIGIPWTAFSAFWIAVAVWFTLNGATPGVGWLFPLGGVPFVLFGAVLVSSPSWLGSKARRTVYALTDRRAIVFDAGVFGGSKVRSFGPERAALMSLTERPDGSGDLIFEVFRDPRDSGTTFRRGFKAVPHVREVQDLVLRTLVAGRVRPIDAPSV